MAQGGGSCSRLSLSFAAAGLPYVQRCVVGCLHPTLGSRGMALWVWYGFGLKETLVGHAESPLLQEGTPCESIALSIETLLSTSPFLNANGKKKAHKRSK